MNAITFLTDSTADPKTEKPAASEEQAYLRLLSVVLDRPVAELAVCCGLRDGAQSPAAA